MLFVTSNDLTVQAPAVIDPMSAEVFARELAGLPADATVKVDGAEVGFIDSSGLRVLIEARSRQVEGGGHLLVINASPTVIRLLELTGLAELLLTDTTTPN